jgi:hypothetical protein
VWFYPNHFLIKYSQLQFLVARRKKRCEMLLPVLIKSCSYSYSFTHPALASFSRMLLNSNFIYLLRFFKVSYPPNNLPLEKLSYEVLIIVHYLTLYFWEKGLCLDLGKLFHAKACKQGLYHSRKQCMKVNQTSLSLSLSLPILLYIFFFFYFSMKKNYFSISICDFLFYIL